jgi:hypothetical protein
MPNRKLKEPIYNKYISIIKKGIDYRQAVDIDIGRKLQIGYGENL